MANKIGAHFSANLGGQHGIDEMREHLQQLRWMRPFALQLHTPPSSSS